MGGVGGTRALAHSIKEGKGKHSKRERKRKRKRKEKGKGKENERKRKRKGIGGKGKRKGKRKGEGTGRVVKEGKGKRRGKGEERERKGRGKGEEKKKKDRVSHGAFLIPKVIVFVIVLLSFVNPVYVPFFWKWLQTSKKECSDYPGTFLMQNLIRICWHAITTTNNEMKKPKTLNSCRTMEQLKKHWISRVWTQIINRTNVQRYFFFILSFFRVKAKNGSWGIMED